MRFCAYADCTHKLGVSIKAHGEIISSSPTKIMGLVATKSVFGVFVKARFEPVSSATSLNIIIFACSMFRDDTFQNANNKGADQAARMRRLVCAFVVRKVPKTGFLASRPINITAVNVMNG